ncbi:unnamed protein product [Ectocarpus sp. 12 AP-2014]
MEAASPRKAANEPYNSNHIPVFLDRTFSFIEDASPDIVCWSEAGDSFIIKKVLAFEGLLPSYYNHKKFLSFVRQLNFYGFKKVRGRGARSRAGSASSGAQGEAAEAEESASWEEFRHPQFRRGRRDLLVGIKRQKDDGRMKRRQADVQKSDVLGNLMGEVGVLSDDLKVANGKLDDIVSLLFGMVSGNRPVPGNLFARPQNVGGDDGFFGFGGGGGGGGGSADPALYITAPNPAAARGGPGQQYSAATGEDGVANSLGHDPYVHGAQLGYITPCLPAGQQQQQQQQQQQGWQGHQQRFLQQPPLPFEQYAAVAPNPVNEEIPCRISATHLRIFTKAPQNKFGSMKT